MQPAALDLTPLYRHPVFESRSAQESHEELSRLLTAHRLRWGAGAVATALYRSELPRISLLFLRYGAEVQVEPDAFEQFTLVQMPLHGVTAIDCDGLATEVRAGEVAVVSPREVVRLHWQQQCEQLIIKIPSTLLRTRCPLFKLSPALVQTWQGIVQQLLGIAGIADRLDSNWMQQFEGTAAGFLQLHQDADSTPPACSPAARRRALGRIDQMEGWMRERLCAPISLSDLARAAGVSPSTLNEICQAERGATPMLLLRRARLEAARRRLLADASANVTDVALEVGFGHLGRFSAYYREQFGELPHETRLGRH